MTEKIIFLDDQFIKREFIMIERYVKILDELDIKVIRTKTVNEFYDKLLELKQDNIDVSGFIIDLMLHYTPEGENVVNNFSYWGVDSLKYRFDIAGAQVIELFTSKRYIKLREDEKSKMHLLTKYEDVKFLLLSAFEDANEILLNRGISGERCSYICKEDINVKERISEWVSSLRK